MNASNSIELKSSSSSQSSFDLRDKKKSKVQKSQRQEPEIQIIDLQESELNLASNIVKNLQLGTIKKERPSEVPQNFSNQI
jgi:hypothetical protein